MRNRLQNSRRVIVAFCALAVVLAMPPAVRAQAPPRFVALVVGNGNYQYWDTLHNAPNDAQLIGATLQKLGFTLVGGKPLLNLDRPGLERALQDFGKQSDGADVALFYYAGHGLQVNGANYLVPTEANPLKPSDLDVQMVGASLAIREMEDSRVRLKVLILDACRDNPYARKVGGTTRGGSLEGLARMPAPEGTIISFATQPDNVAQDGTGTNSPFAAALAATIQLAGLDIFQMLNRVGVRVSAETQKVQQPWFDSSPIDGDFYFAGAEKSPGRDPQNAALHYKKGSDFYNSGNLIDAAAEYRTAMNFDPTDPDPHFGLGLVYDDGKNFDAAVVEYQAAIKLDAKYVYAHNNLGIIYDDRQNYAGAMTEYQAAIAADPKYVYAYNNIGKVYREQKNDDAALKAYEAAAKLDPKYATPHNGLGNIYYDRDKYDEATAEYQAAANLNKSYASPHNGLGNVYFVAKKYDLAIDEYRIAISLDPNYAYPHYGLGYVYFAQNNLPVAVTELRTALSINPKFAEAHRELAAVYRALGNADAAAAEDRLATP